MPRVEELELGEGVDISRKGFGPKLEEKPVLDFVGSFSGMAEKDEFDRLWRNTMQEGYKRTKTVAAEMQILAKLLQGMSLKNNILEGSVPESPLNCIKPIARLLQRMSLNNNILEGSVPESPMNCIKPKYLEFRDNELKGKIPDSLGNGGNSTVQNNKLEDAGSISDIVGNSTKLEEVELDQNQLSGPISGSLGKCTNVEKPFINGNHLTGSMSDSLGKLANLPELFFSNNNLEGEIPSGISNLTALRELDLKTNKLTGSIPDSLGNLTALKYLDLKSNKLTGSNPDSLGNLTALKYLDLKSNKLTGSKFQSLNKMKFPSHNLNDNQLSVGKCTLMDPPREQQLQKDALCSR